MAVSEIPIPTASTSGGASSSRLDDVLNEVRPPIYRGIPYLKVLLVVVVLFAFRMTITEGRVQQNIFNDWLLYAMVVLGFYFVFGISGQFAFSQAAMFGLGAYTSHWATHNPDNPWFIGPIAAVILCSIIAVAFSLIMKRTAHFYFAVGTLALQEIFNLFIRKSDWFTHSGGGEVSNIRPISLFGTEFVSYVEVFRLLIVTLGLLFVMGYFLERSPVRREAIANRDRDVVAKSLGLPIMRLRISTFVLGAAVAGFAGSLWGHRASSASVEEFGVNLGLGIFLMLILGGIGSMWGALLGAWFYVYVRERLQRVGVEIFGKRLSELWGIIYGSLLILVMVLLPDGIVGLGQRIRRLVRRDGQPVLPNHLARTLGLGRPYRPPAGAMDVGGSARHLVPAGTPAPPRGEALIEASDITVSFGGVKAVDAVDVTLHRNEILGLIGPNGSGKSTFVNAITGVVHATGHLRIAGADVPLEDPTAVRAAGVLRTYQTPQTFLELTCIENVLLSTIDRRYTGIVSSTLLRPLMLRHEKQRWRRAAEALERVGLLERAEESAANLSYGQQRLLELARTIAGDPTIVLLDEPSAGLNASETEVLAGHLRRLRNDGITLLLIDHKIDFISSICDRVVVLELGKLVAEGDPIGIWDDERVVNAYLGVADASDTAEEVV
jgi:branched-chain amino acid transport system permease protein